ncbi:MAG TPA: hypothetical protein VHL34_22075 [Rhizomicrobium sp.]|nr:hypothetical protein [Rhizomicrobium sp.]
MALTKAQFTKIALSFPEAHEKSSYGNPAIFIAKKFFTRWRKEEDSIVWIVDGMDERDHLLEIDPKTYFITEHYRDYPSVLVRAEKIDATMLKKMLERRWRKIAPKTLVKQVDAAAAEKAAPVRKRPVRKPARKTAAKAP